MAGEKKETPIPASEIDQTPSTNSGKELEKTAPDGPSMFEDPEDYLRQFPELGKELKSLFRNITDLSDSKGKLISKSKTSGDPKGNTRTLGDFKILREIRSGGMGTVYEAEQMSLHRKVALKVLFSHLSLSKKAVKKFQREAEAAGRRGGGPSGLIRRYLAGRIDIRAL